jgi:hypothetical protein
VEAADVGWRFRDLKSARVKVFQTADICIPKMEVLLEDGG